MNSFAPHEYFPHLRHGEAQLGQFDFADQWDGDAVGQNQVAVDEVLNEAVGEAAVRTKGSRELLKRRRPWVVQTLKKITPEVQHGQDATKLISLLSRQKRKCKV